MIWKRWSPWQTRWWVPSGRGNVAHQIGNGADAVKVGRAGSSGLASRCIRMPTWRCSRTACWAAAIEPGRPTLIGRTMPGNSTVLRTGTMISASDGKRRRRARRILCF